VSHFRGALHSPGKRLERQPVPEGRLKIVQDVILGYLSLRSVPRWSIHDPVQLTQDLVLGNFQPSLRDFSMSHQNPGLRPGLFSAVPAGLNLDSGTHADTKAPAALAIQLLPSPTCRLMKGQISSNNKSRAPIEHGSCCCVVVLARDGLPSLGFS
jgi:hypothetical protein